MPSRPVSSALEELSHARKIVNKVKNRQVRGEEDRLALRSTALAWFHTHRPAVLDASDSILLQNVDTAYKKILSGSDRNTAKTTFLQAMAEAQDALIKLREHLVVATWPTADAAPDFSPLTSDPEMRLILERRWIECTKCVGAHAHLAAIVMAGGLLEALFVARALQVQDRSALVAAKAVPIDKDTGKKLALNKWMLKTYLDVGYEVKWITRTTRDVAAVLGEYRNYVHPEKERQHGKLGEQDSGVLWSVTKALVGQLLQSTNVGA